MEWRHMRTKPVPGILELKDLYNFLRQVCKDQKAKGETTGES